jgi:hypothetical protein
MKCSFIVSAYDRPWALYTLLWCLVNQTEKDFEVIVTDNAVRPDFRDQHASFVVPRAATMLQNPEPNLLLATTSVFHPTTATTSPSFFVRY